MTSSEFSAVRHRLGKTQLQMSQILGISLKSVQSFEQGWRKVPLQAERQALFLLAQKQEKTRDRKPCWVILDCPEEVREVCPAREFSLGTLCWFVNGTLCHGKARASWQDKMKTCRKCRVFEAADLLPRVGV